MAVADEAKSAELIARLEQLPFSRWHRSFFILAFFGIMFDAADFALFDQKRFGKENARRSIESRKRIRPAV